VGRGGFSSPVGVVTTPVAFFIFCKSSCRHAAQRQPVASAGIGPCGNSAHQQFPSGWQIIAASQRAHRVSIRQLSPVVCCARAVFICAAPRPSSPARVETLKDSSFAAPPNTSSARLADASADLWQTRCLRGMVFCAAVTRPAPHIHTAHSWRDSTETLLP
jgi:hypothetical protein